MKNLISQKTLDKSKRCEYNDDKFNIILLKDIEGKQDDSFQAKRAAVAGNAVLCVSCITHPGVAVLKNVKTAAVQRYLQKPCWRLIRDILKGISEKGWYRVEIFLTPCC